MKFTFNGVEYATFALFLAAVAAHYATLAEADRPAFIGTLGAKAKKRFEDMEDAVTQAGNTVVVADIDWSTIIVESELLQKFKVPNGGGQGGGNVTFNGTYAKTKAQVKLPESAVKDVRMVKCELTGRTSATNSAELLLTFRDQDGEPILGNSFESYFNALRQRGNSLFPIKNGQPVLYELKEGEQLEDKVGAFPIVSINLFDHIEGETGYWKPVDSDTPADAYVENDQWFVFHTSTNQTFRGFSRGLPKYAQFKANEKLVIERNEKKGLQELENELFAMKAKAEAGRIETVGKAEKVAEASGFSAKVQAIATSLAAGWLTPEEAADAKAKLFESLAK